MGAWLTFSLRILNYSHFWNCHWGYLVRVAHTSPISIGFLHTYFVPLFFMLSIPKVCVCNVSIPTPRSPFFFFLTFPMVSMRVVIIILFTQDSCGSPLPNPAPPKTHTLKFCFYFFLFLLLPQVFFLQTSDQFHCLFLICHLE